MAFCKDIPTHEKADPAGTSGDENSNIGIFRFLRLGFFRDFLIPIPINGITVFPRSGIQFRDSEKNLIPESTLLFWAMLRFIKNENEILQINNIEKEDSDILDNENSCPSDDCWEMIDGNCSIKTERQESWPKTVICYFTVIAI